MVVTTVTPPQETCPVPEILLDMFALDVVYVEDDILADVSAGATEVQGLPPGKAVTEVIVLVLMGANVVVFEELTVDTGLICEIDVSLVILLWSPPTDPVLLPPMVNLEKLKTEIRQEMSFLGSV